MRLLHALTKTFREFEGAVIPAYAILSHCWEGEEVTYQELRDLKSHMEDEAIPTTRKAGFKKIQQCCQQALQDRLDFVWVDTCCIDKSSSAELSEAINSMYEWYRTAVVCYVYLSDVEMRPYTPDDADGSWVKHQPWSVSRVMKSRWWTRGKKL